MARTVNIGTALILTPDELWRASYDVEEFDTDYAERLLGTAVDLIDLADLPTADAAHDDCRTWQYRPMTRPSRHPLDWNREDA